MNSTSTPWLALVFIGLLAVFASCQREDETLQREATRTSSPLSLAPQLDTRLQLIARQLQREDHRTHLSDSLTHVGAMPLWSSAIIADQGIISPPLSAL